MQLFIQQFQLFCVLRSACSLAHVAAWAAVSIVTLSLAIVFLAFGSSYERSLGPILVCIWCIVFIYFYHSRAHDYTPPGLNRKRLLILVASTMPSRPKWWYYPETGMITIVSLPSTLVA